MKEESNGKERRMKRREKWIRDERMKMEKEDNKKGKKRRSRQT